MLFRPAIIAQILASSANVAMVLSAAPYAIEVIRHWDIRSGSERQLKLERRTYLMSVLLSVVLATQLLALLLFVFNADKMAPVFIGAMCAAGVLNADPYGYPALLAQIAVFFLAAIWLAVNHVDTLAPDYPLVRVKYGLLLGMTPALVAACVLELLYFLNLKADVITSCCSRVFAASAKGLSGDLTALPPVPSMIAFYGALIAAVAASTYTALRRRGGYLVAVTSLAAFAAAIAGILSFLSLYVYEHPNHHCPFCVLKSAYAFQGYWLYIPLFAATACGLCAGAIQPFLQTPSLRVVALRISSRLAGIAAAGFAVFAVVATILILHSHLILIEGVTP
jgi:hypothetical protein